LRCRKLENAQAIISAAVVLHNLLINLHEQEPDLPPNIQEPTFRQQLARGQVNEGPPGRPEVAKFSTRNRIILEFFST